jgi:hypothetical protein
MNRTRSDDDSSKLESRNRYSLRHHADRRLFAVLHDGDDQPRTANHRHAGHPGRPTP